MAFAVPSVVSVGSPISASQWNIMQADLALMQWTTFSPTIGGSVTAPTLGAGTYTGTYTTLGKTIIAKLDLTFGSGMTAGSGTYTFSLPQPAASLSSIIGNARLVHSANSVTEAVVVAATTSAVSIQYSASVPTGALTNVGNSTPWVWASGDIINLDLRYQAA